MPDDLLYEKIIRPLLFSFDPEEVHHFVAAVLANASGLLSGCTYEGDDLSIELFGKRFNNPIGLAAGFDKNARLAHVLGRLGFGFAEIGSVCARPHGGNPRPRLFRLSEDRALINRLGLNGLGAETVGKNLESALEASAAAPAGEKCWLSVNIAKTNDPAITGDGAVADILQTFVRLKNLDVAFATINASCPNTSEGCIKESSMLKDVFVEIAKQNERKLPILVKLSPDSSTEFLEQVVTASKDNGISGFVCGNTSVSREGLKTAAEKLEKIGNGGLSGAPLKALNLQLCKQVKKLKAANQVIIGVGGITSGADAYEYLKAGAVAVELYTGLVYRGPQAVKQICQELSALLQRDGVTLAQNEDTGTSNLLESRLSQAVQLDN